MTVNKYVFRKTTLFKKHTNGQHDGNIGRPKYLIPITVVLLLIIGNGLYWYWLSRDTVKSTNANIEMYSYFTVYPASPDIYSTGVIKSDKSARISPPIAGIVRRVIPERFSSVKAGDVLIEMDNRQGIENLRQEEINLEALNMQLNQANAYLEHLKSVYNKYLELFEWGVVAAMTVDEAKANVVKQEYDVKLVEKRLSASNASIQYLTEQTEQTSIKAPISGIVTDVLVTEGQFVAPGGSGDQASTLLVISDTNALFAQLLVDEIDVSRIRVGQRIELKFDALPRKQASGKIQKIAPSPNNSAGKPGVNFEITVSIETKISEVRVGMTVFAVIQDTRSEPRKIPLSALLANEKESWVWQVAQDRIQKKIVEVSNCTDDQCVLVNGLESGAKIVAGPAQMLLKLSEGQLLSPDR